MLLASPSPGVGAAETSERAIQVDGLRRTFRVYVPAAVASPAPLVFVLHGGGGTARNIERSVTFNALADRFGFVVVYPNAVDRTWNDARHSAEIRSQRENIDDVGFISALIDLVSREMRIDRRRIFATGISNGGFMSQRLAVDLSERIAAIAPVAAGMAPGLAARFPPSQPVSVLVMNGTRDPLVPYHGGRVLRRGETIDTDEIIRMWVQHNRCVTPGVTVLMPDTDPDDGTRVRKTTYTGCAGGADVALYAIEDGGHTWPGGSQYLPRGIVGRVCRDIDATRVIWEFFSAHPKP
jgi:polyhydroxybutyrate depolymerase